MTDNIMTKRKETKGQTMIYKTLHRKLKIEQHEPSPLDNWFSGSNANINKLQKTFKDLCPLKKTTKYQTIEYYNNMLSTIAGSMTDY